MKKRKGPRIKPWGTFDCRGAFVCGGYQSKTVSEK